MTIIEKWRLMMSSFEDIRAAIVEKGGTIPEGKGYNRYANAVRLLYCNTYTEEYEYPKRLPVAISNAINYIRWCKVIKEQIRQAIIGGGVECGVDVLLSEYGNKIRQISTLRISTEWVMLGEYDTPCSAQYIAYGGTPPYKWERISVFGIGGCTISENGVISGTPTSSAGTYNIKLRVTDAEGNTAEGIVPTVVDYKVLYFATRGETEFVYDGQPHTLDFVCINLPDAEFEVTYGNDNAESVTERGSYVANIKLTGETAKGYRYRVDYNSIFLIKIRSAPELQITTREVVAEYDTPVTAQLQAIGGQPPYKWGYTNDIRPPGCTITEDGVLSGTPTMGNALVFLYMQVMDATGRTATGRIGFRINSKLLHFKVVGGGCFQYTGEPQRLNIVCTDKADAEFKVVYGAEETESVTDCGQFLAQVILTGETAKGGKYRTDYKAVIQISGWTLNVNAEKSQVYTYDEQPHAFEYTVSVVENGTPPDGGTAVYYKPYVQGDNTWNADMSEYTTDPPADIGKYRVCIKATGRYERVTQNNAGYNEWWGVLKITNELRIISPINLYALYNQEYEYQLQARGGTPPYKWECEALPYYGLTLSEDGIISGTPTESGIMCSYPNGLHVTDTDGNIAKQKFELALLK